MGKSMFILTAVFLALTLAGCGKNTLSSSEIADIVQQAGNGDMSGVALLTSAPSTPEIEAAKEKVLRSAVAADDSEAVRQLIEAGTDVRSRDESGIAALHWAAMGGNVEIAKLLLEAGADANDPVNALDGTALHAAGTKDMVELLVAHGANVNARDTDGNTPLHGVGTAEAAKALIAHGADVNAADKNGWTPLHLSSDYDVMCVLLANGAKVNARSTRDMDYVITYPAGTTPLGVKLIYNANVDAQSRELDLVQLLRKHGGHE